MILICYNLDSIGGLCFMNEKNLEKTKPIKILSELNDSRSDRYEEEKEETRSEKYEDVLEEEKDREREEEAEEALALKNIALAESYLALEEKKEENLEPPKKKSWVEKLKENWHNLDKKKKIMIITIGVLLLILIIVLIVFFVTKLNKPEEEKPKEEVVEEAPVLADNFYYKGGSLYFLDDLEEEIGSYECENQDSNLCYVAYNNYRDNFDVDKLEDEEGEEIVRRVPIYENNYVFIFDNEDEKAQLLKLYSIKDEEVKEEYNVVKAFADNMIIVADKDNKYGLIKIENGITEVVPLEYEYLGMIDGEDNLIAQDEKGYIVINKNNKKLSSTFNKSYEIKKYNNNFVVAKVGGDYNLYNYKADLIDGGYNYIDVIDKYAALVDNSSHVYVIDNTKLKYNEGDILLDNKDYVKTYIYDEEDNLVKTNRSFEWKIKSDSIEFAIYEDGIEDATYKNLSITEALVNKNYKYVNYFNSKLYFYSDAEKEILLGSYSCSNQNNVSKESDTYTTCFVAKDTIYEDNDMMGVNDSKRKALSPLINDTFVFVNDGPNDVKLVNLKSNKVMGTYTNINTYTADNNYVFDKKSGKVNIVAMNKKGKYGVLEIDGSEVEALYTFDYNKIEKLGEYYLAQDTSNNWKVLFKESETALIPGKILGYNSDTKYLKAKVNNKYAVYDINGNAIGNDYEYVELYSSYYAAVNKDKEIYIYNYTGEQITNEGIKVGNYAYTRTDKPAFKVKKDGSEYIISVYDGSTYNDNRVEEVKINEGS